MRLEQPTEPAFLLMPADRPTRQPGTPVGELLARPSSQRSSTSCKPLPSQSPESPLEILCSDSDSDLAYITSPSSPILEERPKPSIAPHLISTASTHKPSEAGLSLPKEDFDSQIALSLPNEDFSGQINFEFCKQQPRTVAYTTTSPNQGSQPKSRACAKLLVRSGLRCFCCFSLKSDCLCVKHFAACALACHTY